MLVAASVCHAIASGSGTVSYIGGMFQSPSYPRSVYFGITPAPINRESCNNNSSYQFVFDPSTDDGKALYAALMMAISTGRQIYVYGTGSCVLGQAMEGVSFWSMVP
jgi:hypothetical protein